MEVQNIPDKVNVFPSDRITWIKADPTFEGLKQIIYELEERVCIQKDNPAFEIEKCPFTRIYIPTSTNVFEMKRISLLLPKNFH